MVYNFANRLLDILFPPTCRLCGKRVGGGLALCAGCDRDLPRLTHACRQCAGPLTAQGQAEHCGHCQQQAPHFDRTTALCHYHPPVDYLIKRLKFAGDLGMAPLLAGLLAERLARRADPLPALLVPVPLHPARLRERGYNQAIELARPLGWLVVGTAVLFPAILIAHQLRRDGHVSRALGIYTLGIAVILIGLAPVVWADLGLRRRCGWLGRRPRTRRGNRRWPRGSSLRERQYSRDALAPKNALLRRGDLVEPGCDHRDAHLPGHRGVSKCGTP